MNTAGGQPQQGQAGQAGQSQSRPPPMYQPAQIRSLPFLSEEEKVKYEHGVTGLWTRMNSSPPNSQDHLAARNKIIEFSRMLINKIQSRRAQAQQQQGQQQGQQVGAQRPQGQTTQQQTAAAQQKSAQQPAAAATKPAGNANGGAAAPVQSSAAEKPSVTAAITQPKVPERLMNLVNKMTFKAPHHLSEKSAADAAKWVEDLKVRYGRALMTMESAKNKVASMDKVFQERTQAGNPLKDEELRQYREHREKQLELHSNGQKWIETVRKQQETVQGLSQGASAGATHNKANGAATPAEQQNQNVTASVNAAVEAAKNQQQNAGQQQTPATNTPTPQQQQARMAQNAAARGGAAVKQEPPAPVNTALANAQAQTPAQGAARVATPQSANTQAVPGGQTRALSHSAAMSLANQRAAAQPANATLANHQQQQQQQQQHMVQQQQPQQQQQVAQQHQQQQAAVTPTGGTPGAANNTAIQQQQQQQQQQGHPHAHPPQQQAPAAQQVKMPIQKQLPERATAIPQGVTLGGGVAAGRPTLSQGGGTLGGVMNQPAVAKVPAYSHDAEGDHVLSKKKLDELVRQVCGAPSEGASDGNLLTPEVEESVLNMADSFVDNVLHAACRNSKERGSKVLEIRDIQLVLERTYNIRVPGYSSDELRTVRKVQPAAGWIAKMSAVQAAKVMPGKGE